MNPYDATTDDAGPARFAAVAAGAVVLGAAGTVVLAAGAASADEGDGADGGTGFSTVDDGTGFSAVDDGGSGAVSGTGGLGGGSDAPDEDRVLPSPDPSAVDDVLSTTSSEPVSTARDTTRDTAWDAGEPDRTTASAVDLPDGGAGPVALGPPLADPGTPGTDGGAARTTGRVTVPAPAATPAVSDAAVVGVVADGTGSPVGVDPIPDDVQLLPTPVDDGSDPTGQDGTDPLTDLPDGVGTAGPGGAQPPGTTYGSVAVLPDDPNGALLRAPAGAWTDGGARAPVVGAEPSGTTRVAAGPDEVPAPDAADDGGPADGDPRDDGTDQRAGTTRTEDRPDTGGRRQSLVATDPGVVSDTPMDLGISSEPGSEVLVAVAPPQPLDGEPVDPAGIFDPAQRGMIEFAQGPAAEYLDLVLRDTYRDTAEVGEALRRFVTAYPEYLECDIRVRCITTTAPDGTTTVVPGTAHISRTGDSQARPFRAENWGRVPQDAAGVGLVQVDPPAFGALGNDAGNFPAVGRDDLGILSRLAHRFRDVPRVTGTTVNGFTGDTLEFEVPRWEGPFGPEIGMPERYEVSNPLGLPVADRIRILDRTYSTVDPLPSPSSGNFDIQLAPGTRVAPPGTGWRQFRPIAEENAAAEQEIAEARESNTWWTRLSDLEQSQPETPADLRSALARFEYGFAAGDGYDNTPFWLQEIPDPWDVQGPVPPSGRTSEPVPAGDPVPLLPGTRIRGLLPEGRDDVADGTGTDPATSTAAPGEVGEQPATGAPGGTPPDGAPQEGDGTAAQDRGVEVNPDELLRRPGIDELLEQVFPGGDPKRRAPTPDPPTLFPRPEPRAVFDPNDAGRGGDVPPASFHDPETFPSGEDVEGAGPRFTFPLGPGSTSRATGAGRRPGAGGRSTGAAVPDRGGDDGSAAPQQTARSGWDVARGFLTGPVTMQQLPDGGYRAVGGLGGHLGVGYDAVYDRSGNLVSTVRGTAPSTVDPGQHLDVRTGAALAGIAAVPFLAAEMGAGGVGLGGSTVAAGLLPVTGADPARPGASGTGPATRLGRPVCSPALQRGCVQPGSWSADPNSAGRWVAGPRIVGRGVPGHPDYDRLVAEGRAGQRLVGPRLVGRRFVGDGSGTPRDRAATTLNNLASGYTINRVVEDAGRRLQDEVRRNGLLDTVLKGASGIFR